MSLSKGDFIQLIPYDKDREDEQKRRKEIWFEQNLVSQIGLRWIAEGMCPHVDNVLPQEYIAPNAYGNLERLRGCNYPLAPAADDDRESYDANFTELISRFSRKRTVLVGHNIFLDLVYFYSCFFGSLPNRVEDFQQIMGYLFPMVFDTKYLADKINNNSATYNSSLEDLDRELAKLPSPIIGALLAHFERIADAEMCLQRLLLGMKSMLRTRQHTKPASTAFSRPKSSYDWRRASEQRRLLMNVFRRMKTKNTCQRLKMGVLLSPKTCNRLREGPAP